MKSIFKTWSDSVINISSWNHHSDFDRSRYKAIATTNKEAQIYKVFCLLFLLLEVHYFALFDSVWPDWVFWIFWAINVLTKVSQIFSAFWLFCKSSLCITFESFWETRFRLSKTNKLKANCCLTSIVIELTMIWVAYLISNKPSTNIEFLGGYFDN